MVDADDSPFWFLSLGLIIQYACLSTRRDESYNHPVCILITHRYSSFVCRIAYLIHCEKQAPSVWQVMATNTYAICVKFDFYMYCYMDLLIIYCNHPVIMLRSKRHDLRGFLKLVCYTVFKTSSCCRKRRAFWERRWAVFKSVLNVLRNAVNECGAPYLRCHPLPSKRILYKCMPPTSSTVIYALSGLRIHF